MKKTFLLLVLLALCLQINLYAQDKKEAAETQLKAALLVIDIQNAYLPMVPEREKEVAMYYIENLISLFRSHHCPIIRIYQLDTSSGAVPGKELFEFPATVPVTKDDPMIIKTYGDGFNKTDLDKLLKEKGCNTVFLCGLSAVGCVLATWIGAQNHDYHAYMIKNAIMSHNSDYTKNVEGMFDAVGYDIVKLLLETSDKK
jgi:nicotinamidase-related amidase